MSGATNSVAVFGSTPNAVTTAGLVLSLDVGNSGSYSGSGQLWVDLVAVSADFWRGASVAVEASDPTFNGSAGGLSSAEYWSVDGAQYFTYSAANATWMNNLHKNNAAYTIEIWAYVWGTGNDYLMSTMNFSTKPWFEFSSITNRPGIQITNDTFNALSVGSNGGNATNPFAWNMIAMSLDEATGAGGAFFYVNGGYATVSGANTWDCTYYNPSTAAAINPMHLLSRGDGSQIIRSGSQLAIIRVYNVALTKTQLDGNWYATKNRFGL